MAELPSGTVTFLFTDVEGSTTLLHQLGAEAYAAALAEHRRVIREACARHDGVEVDTQGDAFFFAFPTAPGAIAAAEEMRAALASGPIQVRIGLHTGTPLRTDEGYVGDDVHFAARIAASSHGGQVVLSAATAGLVELSLTDLGEHRLKDIAEAVPIYQLGDGSFPPLKTISNTNLPRPASSFVGREAELSEVLARIAAGARLVTLTGPGGTGKTRLALEAAASLVPEYKAGVFWVGLAALRDAALVSETISQTLGAKDGLPEHIAEREMLLLLDNLEQVIEAAPDLSSLLTSCPNLTLLVTSRELLRVQGEVEYAVPPLAEPDAISLFCQRAQLEPDEMIAELCARLDSLPLAVELAAARTKALSPTQILERLSQRLDLLKGGRGADPRQQTLRATIEWSYELLTPEEQQLFAHLSVFAGGCTLEAAEEVAGADLDTLQSLVEKSVLRYSNERFWMLETIRDYAAARLEETGEREKLRQRHAAHMLVRYAEMSREGSTWVPLFESERDNLRAAMSWALEMEESELSLTLAAAFGALCALQGPFSEGRRWLDAALQQRGEATPAARWKALHGAASLAAQQGDHEQAEASANEALALARSMGDPEAIGRSLRGLGIVVGNRGELESAESLEREALTVFSQSGNDREVRETLGMLAWISIARRDYSSARSAIEEALALSREAGDRRGILVNVSNLGHVLGREGQFEEALGPLRESILLAHEQLHVSGVANQLEDLAGVAAGLGKCEVAAAILGGAEALFERTEAAFDADPVGRKQHEETLARLEQELDEGRLLDFWDRGRKMSLDGLVAYAVEFIDSAA